ncbi:MAG: FmdE family protein [Candidatus Hydrothermarchaeota archaeon]
MEKRDKSLKELKEMTLDEILETVRRVHGHVCTASYLGARMGMLALKKLDIKRKRDLCATVEVLTCAADGIASATNCSFGSGRLTFKDYGKFAAIFCDRRTGKTIRIRCREDVDEEHIRYGSELAKFYEKVDNLSDEEAEKWRKELFDIEDGLLEKWNKMGDDELFIVSEVKVNPEDMMYPLDTQYITNAIKCARCNDLVEERKTVEKDGKRYCRPCAGEGIYKEIK